MRVRARVYVRTCKYVYVNVVASICVCICTYVRMCVRVWTYVALCARVCSRVIRVCFVVLLLTPLRTCHSLLFVVVVCMLMRVYICTYVFVRQSDATSGWWASTKDWLSRTTQDHVNAYLLKVAQLEGKTVLDDDQYQHLTNILCEQAGTQSVIGSLCGKALVRVPVCICLRVYVRVSLCVYVCLWVRE
jgi:hypothetical protein